MSLYAAARAAAEGYRRRGKVTEEEVRAIEQAAAQPQDVAQWNAAIIAAAAFVENNGQYWTSKLHGGRWSLAEAMRKQMMRRSR